MTRNRRLRLLFADVWTKGTRRIFELTSQIGGAGAEPMLFHLGSYYEDGVPRVEVRDGVACADVRAFRGMGLEDILRSLEPDGLVVFRMANLFDRALLLTAERLGIPTVFLQHGAWGDRDKLRPTVAGLDKGFSWADRIRRVPRMARVLPWYLQARGKSLVDPVAWRVVFELARAPFRSYFYPIEPRELWPSVSLVFNEESAETLATFYGIPRERIQIVGNPELDAAVSRRNQALPDLRRRELRTGLGLMPDAPVACYIEDAFVEQQSMFGWDEARRVRYMLELLEVCARAGCQLLIRPHPSTDVRAMTKALAGLPGAVINRDLPLLDTLSLADVGLGTISTALESLVVLQKPLVIPAWHLNGDRDYCPFLRYGAAHAASSPEELRGLLSRAAGGTLEVLDSARLEKARLGPIDGNATQRICRALQSLGVGGVEK